MSRVWAHAKNTVSFLTSSIKDSAECQEGARLGARIGREYGPKLFGIAATAWLARRAYSTGSDTRTIYHVEVNYVDGEFQRTSIPIGTRPTNQLDRIGDVIGGGACGAFCGWLLSDVTKYCGQAIGFAIGGAAGLGLTSGRIGLDMLRCVPCKQLTLREEVKATIPYDIRRYIMGPQLA